MSDHVVRIQLAYLTFLATFVVLRLLQAGTL
jgi:hypothetical protein